MFDATFRATWAPCALSALRIVAGFMFMQHGLSKYFAFPAASPPTFQMMSQLGAAGAIEIVCGLLIGVGLFTSPAAFIASGMCAIGFFQYHLPRGFFPQANGGELIALYCWVFFYLFLAGGGSWSLDALRSGRR